MKVLYDDELIPASSGNTKNHPKFVLEDNGEITLYDKSGNEARFTKDEYNRFISAVKSGRVSLI